METTNEMANIISEVIRRSHTDSAVPSSYNWKPTNPLTTRQVHSADVRPF